MMGDPVQGDPFHPVALLRQLEARARRRLGQNFLVDPGVAHAIVEVAGVGPDRSVLEIGPGLGGLTSSLLAAGASVTAIEMDPTLAEWIRESMPQVRLVEADAMEVDLAALCAGAGWLAVANLPFNVATPLVVRMVGMPATFERLVLMVQKEVADRFVARPGCKAYGSLSLEIQVHARAHVALRMGPGVFHPRPKVDSAVVVFDVLAKPDIGAADPVAFRRVVRAAFGQRRKILRNALGAVFGRDSAEAMLDEARISPMERAERLDREDFVRLALAMPAGTSGTL